VLCSLCWLVLGVALVACGPPPRAGETAGAAHDSGAQPATVDDSGAPVRRAPLHFIQLAGRAFPYPLVQVWVRGHKTWMLLDTGASHDVLARWLAAELALELAPTLRPAEGHAGEAVETFVVDRPEMVLESWGPLAREQVLVVDVPVVFERLGLGGLLSPQALVNDGLTVVVDLPNEILYASADSATHGAADGVLLGRGDKPVCQIAGPSPGRVYLLSATVEGVPARLIVDTGAARTDLLDGSAAARAVRHRVVAGGASYTAGGRRAGGRVDDATVRVGELSTVLDLGIMSGAPGGACPRDGHLGLDVLRGCVLELRRNHFDARCIAPPR